MSKPVAVTMRRLSKLLYLTPNPIFCKIKLLNELGPRSQGHGSGQTPFQLATGEYR